jgi:predicted RNA-binding Zn-ribbon protein involved in translation (DUF1610 family)
MNRIKAAQLLAQLKSAGISDSQILDHILGNFMSGEASVSALESCLNEHDLLEDECPSCGSADIFNHHFEYATAQIVYQCRDCDDRWS